MAESRLHLCRLPVYGVHDGENLLVCTHDLAEALGASSPRELVGRDPLVLLAPDAIDEAVRAMLSQNGSYRCTARKLNGDPVPIEVAAEEVRFRGKSARLFTVRVLSPIAVVVDDEVPVAKVTAAVLRHLGYRAAIYNRGSDALSEYEPNVASVLVTDIMMPGMDGLKLVEEIRRLDPTLPVIYMTGFSENLPAQDEMTRVVKKPFGQTDFQRAVTQLPERARALVG